jgi:cytoskeletal protein RodZ
MSDSHPGEATFGDELKRHRLLREVSLESIAAATKISVRHLQALERADFAKLPAPVFTRGFIRAYATFLGLDPEEMVNAYLSETTGASPSRVSAPVAGASRRPSLRAVVLGIVAAAVAILIGAAVWRAARRPRAEDARSPSLPPVSLSPHIRQVPATTPAPAPASATGSSVPAPGTTSPAAPPASAPPSSAPPSSAETRDPVAAPLTLAISTEANCWSQISADGRSIFSGTFRSGETRRFEARRAFHLTAGNAGALRVAVNGRSLPPLGKAGEVVRDLRLDADSVNAMLSRPE